MSRPPRLLDLYCGAGGAAMGYHRADFDVTGVDIRPQPRYPFRFWLHNVLRLEPWVLAGFDAVHASPPRLRRRDAKAALCLLRGRLLRRHLPRPRRLASP